VEGVKKAGSLDRTKVVEALETGISVDGPSGKVTLDHATHHAVRNAYLAKVAEKKWNVIETYPDAKPLDTAGVCDLIKKPADNQQYIINI
jgi:ABC-type branched-subunit amino acid transport system substrate-binding protein